MGRVRQHDPPRVLELTWRFETEPETVLRFELRPAGDETVLGLSHTDLPAELRDDYERGWALYLNALTGLLRDVTEPDGLAPGSSPR